MIKTGKLPAEPPITTSPVYPDYSKSIMVFVKLV